MKYISRLNEQKEVIKNFFDNKNIYKKRYRKGGWTGKEVLIHMKDNETVVYDRLRRIIAEDNPILWIFEQDHWQKNLNYMNQDPDLAKKLFLATRESIIEIIEMHFKKYKSKAGVHSRRGVTTMQQLIEFLIWHTDKHLKHLKNIKPAA